MIWAGLITFVAGAAVTALSTVGPEGSGRATAGVVIMVLGAVMFGGGVLRRALRRRRRGAPGAALSAGGAAGSGVRGAVTGRPVADLRDAVYRTGKGRIAAIAIAALYIVSPLDLVPDVFLPFGVVDDATALTWLIFAVSQEYGRHRQARTLRAQLAERPVPMAPEQPIVPAQVPRAVKQPRGRSPR